jgi:hypothetical protein
MSLDGFRARSTRLSSIAAFVLGVTNLADRRSRWHLPSARVPRTRATFECHALPARGKGRSQRRAARRGRAGSSRAIRTVSSSASARLIRPISGFPSTVAPNAIEPISG